MRRFMPIVDEIEGREWCELNGYIYCGTRIHKDYGYVMEYEDGLGAEMSKEEEEYYIRQNEKEQKKQSVLNKIILLYLVNLSKIHLFIFYIFCYSVVVKK